MHLAFTYQPFGWAGYSTHYALMGAKRGAMKCLGEDSCICLQIGDAVSMKLGIVWQGWDIFSFFTSIETLGFKIMTFVKIGQCWQVSQFAVLNPGFRFL
jgi:hypothetical protein